jgi:hypothetical protein
MKKIMKTLTTFLGLLLLTRVILAEPLDYSVSWIGNSFSGGDAGWVPQDVQDIFVTPDGTVYTTVGWEEHRGNIAAFRGGKILQQSAHWKSGGIDRLVGETITANETFIFFATGTPNGHDGKVQGTNLARRERSDIASRKNERRREVGIVIKGLAVSADRLFAACEDQKIRVFDLELNKLDEWPIPAAGEMAAAPDGNLWLIDENAGTVYCIAPDGLRIKNRDLQLEKGVIPRDIAITSQGDMLIADGGRNRQIRIYHELDRAPVFKKAMGEPGGVFSGAKPGAFGELRLIAPIGVGTDQNGNVYVACGPYSQTHGGTAIIQSYSPDGELNWRVMSTEWLDTVDVDQTSGGTVLYGSKYRYALDLDQPVGRQWTLQAITLDPDRYPEDPRLKSAALGGVWHRVIQGRRFLFFPDMNGGNLYIYRFDPETEGEIAIPCGTIATGQIWLDANADGRSAASEVSSHKTGETRGWFVEENGTVWQATRNSGIFAYPMAEISDNGVPIYRQEDRVRYNMPEPFTELRRIRYDRTTDTMYLAGSTADARAEHWKPMGPNLIQFKGWHKERTQTWSQVMPHEKAKGGHESYEPFDFAVEGDFVFVVYAGRLPSQNLPTGTVMVLDKGTGEYVGHMQPSGTRTGTVPMDALQDMVHSINAHRLADGEYLVFIEDDGYTKNVMYRWKP